MRRAVLALGILISASLPGYSAAVQPAPAPAGGARSAAGGQQPVPASAEPFFLAIEGVLPVPGGFQGSSAQVTFQIADHPRKGKLLWSEGPVAVPVRDGYFSATLGGGGIPVTLALFTGRRWLRIECEGCRGRTSFPMERTGRGVAVKGLQRPDHPGPAAARPLLRNRLLHDQRAYPTGIVPGGLISEAWAGAQGDSAAIGGSAGVPASSAMLSEGSWTEIGPIRVTGGQTGGPDRGDVSGRVNAIALHPTDPDIAYVCGAQGGLWKTTDAGASWTAMTDQFPSLATGAVAVAASSPDVVYLGTGEANFSIDSYWGAGVFKSVDAGAGFSSTAALDPNRTPSNSAAIAAVEVHPGDPDMVIAAVGTFQEGNSLFSGGLYRTTDGGASWDRVIGPGLTGGAIVASDVLFDPVDPNVVYAATGWIGGSSNNGVWKSTDAGATFSKLSLGMTSGDTANTGRINLAIAPSDPQVVYAAVQNVSTLTILGIWRTTDGGANWSKRSAIGASCGTQCWYDMELAVSPAGSDTIFFGGVNLFRSTNGATTFTNVITTSGSTGGIHVDQHALKFSPSSTSRLWVGNDGGMWRTDDAAGSTPLNWVNLNTNLALLQFQSVAVPPSDPNIAFGGTQDNGTNRYGGNVVWEHSADGDGGQTLVDFIDPQVVYHAFFGVSIQRSDTGGGFGSWSTRQTGLNTADRALFYVPIEMDPGNSSVLYLGSYRLYRTVNKAGLWTAISGDLTVDPGDPNNVGEISAIGLTAADPNVIYIGTSNAQIRVTSNLGSSWTNRVSAPLPDRYVTSIAVHPADGDRAWVAYSGFDSSTTGNGHVFMTIDRGVTWTDVTNNLPAMPVNQLTIDPAKPRLIYASTDIGPYVSTNSGASWRRYAGGFPNVAVFEIAVQQPNTLFAATHGRGMFQAYGCTDSGTTDLDGDGIADFCDVCPGTSDPNQVDADADGFGPPCDCNDLEPNINPSATEICDAVDNNCDGSTDEDNPGGGAQCGTSNVGECTFGAEECLSGSIQCAGNIEPATEVCDGLDNDCDGMSDLGSAPPGEPAVDLEIDHAGTLAWGAVTGAEEYNLYRGGFTPAGGFTYNESCLTGGIAGLTVSDSQDPVLTEGFFYLLSAKNCLSESGVGQSSSGPRPSPTPCP